MQANLDNEKAMMARFNWRWSNALVTKTMANFQPGPTGQTMVSIENDYTGSDFTASIKALNPSLLEGGLTGMVTAEYLQSITSRLSLGLAALWQRQAMSQGPEMMLTYAARYKTPEWIASAQFISLGVLQASYWRRIADRVEGGVSAQLSYAPSPSGQMMGGGAKAEGVATIGAKYDFRTSQFKAQVDSAGRIGCLLEKRLAPAVSVTFVGQIDHVKVSNTALEFFITNY
jgi:mitochondrial import receptor subunit TOM40